MDFLFSTYCRWAFSNLQICSVVDERSRICANQKSNGVQFKSPLVWRPDGGSSKCTDYPLRRWCSCRWLSSKAITNNIARCRRYYVSPLIAVVAPPANYTSRQVSLLFIFSHLVCLSFLRNFNAAWLLFIYQSYAPNGAKSRCVFNAVGIWGW